MDTRVCATPNSIRIEREGDSSKDIDGQLSKKKTEDDGAKKYRSKCPLQNFDARHGKIESEAVVKSRQGGIGVERGKGVCYRPQDKKNAPGQNKRKRDKRSKHAGDKIKKCIRDKKNTNGTKKKTFGTK